MRIDNNLTQVCVREDQQSFHALLAALFCTLTLLVATLLPSVSAAEQKKATNTAQQIAKGMDDGSLLFLSTQLTPIHEADTMRRVILKEFPGNVDFQPYDNPTVFRKLALAKGDGKLKPDLLGVLHGDLRHLYLEGGLTPVDATDLFRKRSFIPDFVELGKLGSDRQLYIPWMQATYIMAANRKALHYLPRVQKSRV